MERAEWATKDRKPPTRKPPTRKPTVRQLVALAAALCERADVPFPETRADASDLIERLRLETGHPAPRLDDLPASSEEDARALMPRALIPVCWCPCAELRTGRATRAQS